MDKINYTEYDKIVEEIKELSVQKNNDYGCRGLIGFGNYGILVRISDKLDRLKNIYDNNKKISNKNEKIEDTLKDIVNYALYMILQERGVLTDGENKKL